MYGGRSLLQVKEEQEKFVRKPVMYIVVCVVSRCAARSPSPQDAFLFEDITLAFIQQSAFCKVAVILDETVAS